jgi:histidinol phosphatase-like PHP family hydrolase
MLPDVFDCHLHTVRSACGEDITDEWLCARAQENGTCFAVTDHTMHLYYEPEIAWAMMTDDGIRLFEERRQFGRDNLLRYLDDLRSCDAADMRVGVELDVLPDGQLMIADDLRDELDVLVGAIHYQPTIKHKLGQAEVEAEFRRQTQWLLQYGVHVLAHPFRILLAAGYEVGDELLHWTVAQAGEHGAALEINSHKPFPDHDVRMARLAVARGQRLAIGTDAHHSREFGEFGYHEDILRRAGLDDTAMQEILFRPDKN